MKMFAAAMAFLLAAAGAVGQPVVPAVKTLSDRGIYVQEFWAGGRPGFWVANGAAAAITVSLAGARSGGKGASSLLNVNTGPLTVPSGGAVSVDAGSFIRLSRVAVLDENDEVIGTLLPPAMPAHAASQPGSVIILPAILNTTAPASPAFWYEIDSIPPPGATSLEVKLKINGAQNGFIAIHNYSYKPFPECRIASVSCSGFAVKQGTNGDWFVDARKPAIPPLQTVVIRYEFPPISQQSIVMVDASLLDTKRILLPLTRAVLIGQPAGVQAAPPAPPVPLKIPRKNRPISGR